MVFLPHAHSGSRQDEKPYFLADPRAVHSGLADDWANQAETGMDWSMDAFAKPTALEFFAGGGLARLGLGPVFDTIWANDFDPMKAGAHRANFGDDGFVFGDVHDIDPTTVPKADLAWASFPCQDLSLAGDRGGLGARRSGAFYGFVAILRALKAQGRAPRVVVLENVSGLLSSRGGQDFAAVVQTLASLGFASGTLEIDARHFVPHSRPRVFIIAVCEGTPVPASMVCETPSPFHTQGVEKAVRGLDPALSQAHIQWALQAPTPTNQTLDAVFDCQDQNWWPAEKARKLLDSFSPRHASTLADLQKSGTRHLGTIYRRTRQKAGITRTFAEPRFDGIAGCLRTPSGGSSRQFWIVVDGDRISIRAIDAREAMRLMGVPDSYSLPKSALSGLKIAGDGVCVPLVSWLARELLLGLVRR
jgi:DNA (cytosine-5)-methyltransferase 1